MSNRSASCTPRGSLRVVVVLGILLLCSVSMNAQIRRCPDPKDDPHFTVLYESSKIRVLSLELGRLESTNLHCFRSNYLSIVTTESRTTVTIEGTAGIGREWNAGEARFHYAARPQTIRNENAFAHREIFIETSLPVTYIPFDRYDGDEFGGDMTTLLPTSFASVTRGPLRATRVKLAPADSMELLSAEHLLIALSDITLKRSENDTIRLYRYDTTILKPGDAKRLTNESRDPARFIVVDF